MSLARALLHCLIVLQTLSLSWPLLGAETGDFVVYDKQVKRLLPKVKVENHDYLPLIDFLQILDLPYSESVSSGFISIGVGKSIIKLTKDHGVAQVNESAVGLSAPVIVAQGRWLVSPDFVSRVLNRVLPEKVTVAASGNRFLIGPGIFNRLDVRALAAEQSSTVVIQMNVPVEAEVKREDAKITLTFANTPLDPTKEDYQYKDGLVESIRFEDSPSEQRLVITLADKGLLANITHLASQNTYVLEVVRPSVGPKPEPEQKSLPPAVISPPRRVENYGKSRSMPVMVVKIRVPSSKRTCLRRILRWLSPRKFVGQFRPDWVLMLC